LCRRRDVLREFHRREYTLGQTTDRCLSEFQQEIGEGGRNALIILSVTLSLLGRHEAGKLSDFTAEIKTLGTLSEKTDLWEGLSEAKKSACRKTSPIRSKTPNFPIFSGSVTVFADFWLFGPPQSSG